MRYYGFCNFMLSSVQQGVQNFHVCHELFNKYRISSSSAVTILHEWSTDHKTAVFLDGGNAAGIRSVYAQLASLGDEMGLPYVKFHEDEDSLDNTMTACGIIVTTEIVNLAQAMRESTGWWSADLRHSEAEIALASFLNQFHLAR